MAGHCISEPFAREFHQKKCDYKVAGCKVILALVFARLTDHCWLKAWLLHKPISFYGDEDSAKASVQATTCEGLQ